MNDPIAQKLQALAAAEMEKRKRAGTFSGGVRAHTEYAGRPVDWMVDILGVKRESIVWSLNPEYDACWCPRCVAMGNGGQPHLWDGDKDPLETGLNLLFAGKSVAMSSGTTLGKTWSLGAAGTLAFLAIIPRSVVFSLAPKQELLLKNLWKGIGELWPKFKLHFPQAQLLTGNLRMLAGEGEQELWTATAFGAGVGANEELSARLKGFHHPNMLWVMEELQGIDPAHVETVVKTASSEFNPICGMGNPNDQHDQLAMFGKRDWVTAIRMSALDYPNVVCDRVVVPGGRSRVSVARDLADSDGDESHPHYLSQVRGIAPAQSQRALIRWEWLEAAAERHNDPALRKGPLALGIDVADSPTGDRSSFAFWQGACCTDIQTFRADDATIVGQMAYYRIVNAENPINPKHVGVDSVGVGASCVNELKRLGVRIRKIHGSAKALPFVDTENTGEDGRPIIGAEKFANERSAVFWRLREDLRLGRIALPRSQKLFEELTALEYKEYPSITVMPKDDVKSRLGRSPDEGDSVAYGNYVRPRIVTERKKDAPEPENRNVDRGLERLLEHHAKQKESLKRRFGRSFGRRPV